MKSMAVVQILVVFVRFLGVSGLAGADLMQGDDGRMVRILGSPTTSGDVHADISSSGDVLLRRIEGHERQRKATDALEKVSDSDSQSPSDPNPSDLSGSRFAQTYALITEGHQAQHRMTKLTDAEDLLTEVHSLDGAKHHTSTVFHETETLVRATPDMKNQLPTATPVALHSTIEIVLASLSSVWLSVLAFGFCYVLTQLVYPRPAAGVARVTVLRSEIPVLAAFLVYWFCGVSHTFAQRDAAAVDLSPLVPTFLIYILKVVIALAMYRGTDGTFAELVRALVDNKSAILSYALPGVCLAIYDALSFVALAQMSPVRYVLLLSLRTVVTAICWQFVMGTWLSKMQWSALMSCVFAVMLTERSTIGDIIGSRSFMGLAPLALLVVMFAVNITGSLANERFLKQIPLTVNAQNVLLYTWGSICMIISALILNIFQGPVFKVSDFHKVLTPSVVMSILTVTFMGIGASYTIKLTSNVVKDMVGMVVMITIAAVDWWVLAISPWGLLDVQAVLMVVLGTGLFSLLHHQKTIQQQKPIEQGGKIEQQKTVRQ